MQSKVELALGILVLLGFLFQLTHIPGVRESARHKIGYTLRRLSALVGGLGFVFSISLLQQAFVLLCLIFVIYESVRVERRAPRTPNA